MNDLPKDIQELIQMAVLYFGDGAPQAAADRLRKAADLMQDASDRRAEYIASLQDA
jgi:hypothetical protein